MSEKITIERLSYSDAGVGHLSNGKVVFVPGTCPGDEIEVQVTEEKKRLAQGVVTTLITPSAHRATPACPYAGICGGCGWQQVAYPKQLEEKRNTVVSQLARTAGFGQQRAEELVAETVPSKRTMGYRNKLEFGCGKDAQGRFTLGMHKAGSNDLLSIESCPLGHKQIEKAPKALRGALRYLSSGNDLGIYRVGVRHSLATGACEIALWTNPGPWPRTAVAKTMENALKNTSVVRVMTKDTGSARDFKGLEVISGKGVWTDTVCDETYSVSAPSFFQVNSAQATKLVNLALDGLEVQPDDYVADLYCGVGTFTLPLARRCDNVFAVESYGSSVRDLRRAAEREGLDIEVIGGDSARELPLLGQLDAIVVDPPRAGLAPTMAQSIAQAKPHKVAYISCDPATLARDAARLEAVGYTLSSATPVDMFPQTFHVETVAIFQRK